MCYNNLETTERDLNERDNSGMSKIKQVRVSEYKTINIMNKTLTLESKNITNCNVPYISDFSPNNKGVGYKNYISTKTKIGINQA